MMLQFYSSRGKAAESRAALLALFQRTYRPIYRYLLARTGSEDRTQALCAELYWRIALHLDEAPQHAENELAWLLAYARTGFQQNRKSPFPLVSASLRGQPDLDSETRSSAIARQAYTASLTASLAKLPRLTADILSLRFVAGLDVQRTAVLVQRSPEQVEKIIAAAVTLWLGLPPGEYGQVPGLLDHLANELVPDERFTTELTHHLRHTPLSLADFLPFNHRWPFSMPIPWPRSALLGLLALGLLATGLWLIGSTPLVGQALQFASRLGPTPEPAGRVVSGRLLPPGDDLCRQWQQEFGQVFQHPASLDQNAPFTDPILNAPGANGRGCQLTITGTGLTLGSLRSLTDNLAPWLTAQGFNFNGAYSVTFGDPANQYSPGDWYVQTNLWRKGSLRAIFTAGWRPAELLTCPTVQPESSCGLLPQQKLVRLRLNFAEDPQAGRPADLAQETALAADPQGRIYRLVIDSNSGRQLLPLTPAGFYHVSPASAGSPAQGFAPHLSPDGNWLLFNQPDGSGAWILDLGAGSAPTRLAGLIETASWSPDSRQVAFTNRSEPAAILTLQIPDGTPRVLANLPRQVNELAWSPDGQWIAASHSDQYRLAPLLSDTLYLDSTYVIVSPLTGEIKTVFPSDGSTILVPPYSLTWSADSQSLRVISFPPGLIAVDIISETLHEGDINQLRTTAGLISRFEDGHITAASPDGQISAEAERLPGQAGLGPIRISRLPAGSSILEIKLEQITTFAWAADSQHILAATGMPGDQIVWWIDTTAGSAMPLSEGLAYIGLLSDLQRTALYRAPNWR